MPALIVYLPPELPQASSQLEYAFVPDGRSVATHSSAALAVLPDPAGSEVVAVVPAQALSWHRVQLPRGVLQRGFGADRGSPRLRAVLDGLLEEHLLDDPAQLHFALAPDANVSAPIWVSACDRAWLRAWMQALEHHLRPATRIVPEFAPGQGLDALQVIGLPTSPMLVFSPINDNAGDGVKVLPLTPVTAELADRPAGRAILAEPALAELAERHFKRPASLQSQSERLLAAAALPWDLAQFEFVSSSRTRNWRRVTGLADRLWRAPPWRAARWATLALLVVNLAGLNAWAWAQRASLSAKRQAVSDTLTTTFPGVKVVIDAPVQMAREVQRLRQAAGAASDSDFESLLAAWGQLTAPGSSLSGKRVASMEYSSNELRIKGLGLTNAQLAEWTPQARQRAVAIRVEGDALVLSAATTP